MARPRKKEHRAEKLNVYVTPEVAQLIQTAAKAEGKSVSEFGYDAMSGAATSVMSYPLFGIIPAGGFDAVNPIGEGARVYPPFALRPECYALLVSGASMASDFGLSIEDGSYAFFCPEIMPTWGAPVHAEIEEDGVTKCTFKRFCPLNDGTIELRPLNPAHEVISVTDETLRVRGVFVRAWKEAPSETHQSQAAAA